MDNNATKSVLGWTIGISAVAFVLLIVVIIFGNLSGNTGIPDSTTSISVVNETEASANTTGYTLSGYNSSWSGISVTALWNATDAGAGYYNLSLGTGNASVSAVGVVTNGSATEYENVSISYSYTYTYTSTAETNAENIIGNYTSGAVNTAAQFPTVGTMLGVALLILILLALLVYVIVKMSGVNAGKTSSGNFSGGNFG